MPHRSPASGKRARLPPQEDPPDDNCIICCFEMPEDGKGRPADCKHVYCVACLLEWAKISNTCPMCKRSFLKICHLQKELSPAPAAGEAASAGQFTPRHDPLTGLFIVDVRACSCF